MKIVVAVVLVLVGVLAFRSRPPATPAGGTTGSNAQTFAFRGEVTDLRVGSYGRVQALRVGTARRHVLLLPDGMLHLAESDDELGGPGQSLAVGGGSVFWKRNVPYGAADVVLMRAPLPGLAKDGNPASRILTRICGQDAAFRGASIDGDDREVVWACDGMVGAVPADGGDRRRELGRYDGLVGKGDDAPFLQHVRLTPSFVYLAFARPGQQGRVGEIVIARVPRTGGTMELVDRHPSNASVRSIDADDTLAYVVEVGPSQPGDGRVVTVGPGHAPSGVSGRVLSNALRRGDDLYWSELGPDAVTLVAVNATSPAASPKRVLARWTDTYSFPMVLRTYGAKLYLADATHVREVDL